MKKKYRIYLVVSNPNSSPATYTIEGPWGNFYPFSDSYDSKEEAEKAMMDRREYAPHFIAEYWDS